MVRYKTKDVKTVLDLYHKHRSFRVVENICGISKSTAHRYWTRFHALCLFESIPFWRRTKKQKNRRRQKYQDLDKVVKYLFKDAKKVTLFSLRDIQNALEKEYKQVPSLPWIRKTLINNKISKRKFKKAKISTRTKEELNQMVNAFLTDINCIPNTSIISIDETSFCNHNVTDEGYFCVGKEPEQSIARKRESLSLLMAVQPNRVISHKLQKDAFNTISFHAYLSSLFDILDEDKLEFGGEKKSYTLIMDNVAFHKSKRIKELVESRGHRILFIPPYSPQCNPIEEVFSELKRRYRSTPIDNFKEKIYTSLNSLQLSNIEKYFKHMKNLKVNKS